MISLTSSSQSLSFSTLLRPPPVLSPLSNLHLRLHKKTHYQRKKRRNLRCSAELSQDAPFVLAIGSCILNSFLFSVPSDQDDGDTDSGSTIGSTDVRFAAMGIISFIPYFNWLSWIFAWLDTGRQRYLVYSIVYLAPYLRTNLSLSPDESWLPLSSIIFCIVHIQLEASIRNGDIKTNELFGEALKFLTPINREKDEHFQGHDGYKKGRNKEKGELPSVQEPKNKLQGWGVPKRPLDDSQHKIGDEDERKRKD